MAGVEGQLPEIVVFEDDQPESAACGPRRSVRCLSLRPPPRWRRPPGRRWRPLGAFSPPARPCRTGGGRGSRKADNGVSHHPVSLIREGAGAPPCYHREWGCPAIESHGKLAVRTTERSPSALLRQEERREDRWQRATPSHSSSATISWAPEPSSTSSGRRPVAAAARAKPRPPRTAWRRLRPPSRHRRSRVAAAAPVAGHCGRLQVPCEGPSLVVRTVTPSRREAR